MENFKLGDLVEVKEKGVIVGIYKDETTQLTMLKIRFPKWENSATGSHGYAEVEQNIITKV